MSQLISRFREKYQHTKKSLGQHFLTNRHFIEEIADAADLSGNKPALEIGPGSGVLTEELARRTHRLTVVEIDDKAAEFLEENKGEFFPHISIIHRDVLTVDIGSIYPEPVTVVGNLPYNLSVRIVEHCTRSIDKIRLMVFMFQKEVAMRIAAAPGSRDYSSLSVFACYHYDIKKIRDISGGNFWPNAKVYSTVLKFSPKKEFPFSGETEKGFLDFVYQAFRQKRKTLRNNLKDYDKLEDALKEADLSPSVRAEQLSLDDFIRIYKYVAS